MADLTSSTLAATCYDFIIIGGGTAGLVVAARLSEDPNISVLVLEAGENRLEDPRIKTPAFWSAVRGSDVDWKFLTVPQEALKGRVIPQPQGKVLGGSSAINAEVFVPPSKSGVDSWAKLGNPGWDWATLAPYFHINWITEEGQGTSGPIQASFQGTIQDPLSKAWTKTLKEVGYCLTGDPFSGSATAGFSSPITVDPTSKTRSYAGSAYFLPASSRKNLHVVTGALVHRILLKKEGENVSVTGVQVELQGALQDVRAQKEVIVSCGALQTPKVLELSGIGDANLLKSHGITPIIDNPNVGENLQDHLMTGISYEVRDGIMTGDSLLRQEPAVVQAAMQMYMENKTGPFCSGGIGSYAFMPITDFATESGKEELRELFEKYPAENKDMEQYNILRTIFEDPKEATGSAFMFLAQVKLHADDSSDFTQNLDPGNFVSLGVSLLHPLSRGSVHIASVDATQPPIVDPKYFSNELDVEFMARHLRFMETIAESQPLASFIKPGGKRNHATAHVKDLEAAKDYVRTTAISNNHPACSCSMMPQNKGGVVNAQLLVYGTANLRIVDASVMPLIPRGNIQSSVYAVAERAADLIKGDHHI